MPTATDNYNLLIEKLDSFIRKFYLNQLIRGLLYSVAIILAMFIAFSVLEYFFYFGKSMRKLLFFSFLGVSGLALAAWVLTPLLHYFRLGKLISHEQAAQIIGNHFANVKDKLLNVLQLKVQSDELAQKELIFASIDQKSEEIKLVPFRRAIDLGQNRKYLRYALPPLLLLLVLLLAAPSVIKDSTTRLINNNKDFEREAPFRFLVDRAGLQVVQYSDFDLEVNVEGDVIPNEAYIDLDNYQYKLTKKDATTFGYKFNNVQKEMGFRITSGGFFSEGYKLKVLKKPNITSFEVMLNYPAYTGRKDETLSNMGDLVVPIGTRINWVFDAENTSQVDVAFSDKGGEKENIKRISENRFGTKKTAMKDGTYKLFISNEELPVADSVQYTLSIIPDLHPSISVEKFVDSTNKELIFFAGEASDDYGLLNLSFNYRIKNDKSGQGELQSIKLFSPSDKQVQYEYTLDIKELELQPGDELIYFFEVFDNDAVNGSKSARTNPMIFAKPTKKEFEEMASKNNEDIKDKLEKTIEESKKIQEDIKKMREKLLQKKELDWQDKKELENLLERQKELEKELEKAKQNFQENLENQQEFEKPNEEILEKQEKLEELFEEVFNEEMQELMEKIEELLQELEKDEAIEMMENMNFNEEEMELELDRMLELFKQLEMEKELQDQIQKLEELAKEQEELSEETEQSETPQEELEEKQEEINEKFDELQEKMEELEKKNEELENPKQLGDPSEKMEDIQQDLDDSQEQLQQKQNKKASQSQKNAAQKMQDMAGAMAAQMQAQQMEQMQEDMKALRQLLENLVGLSFDQEDLMDEFIGTNVYTPRYTELVQGQFKLKDDFRLIEDSLQALAKRVFQIESFVTEKVSEIKRNLKGSLDDLEERKKPQAAEHQQRTMKNVNDLALMLSETMNQMQQQMASMMSGSQMCTNPGQGNPNGQMPTDKITKGQQQLNDQMKQMKNALEKGKQNGGMSKEFAKMAARQAALRKALQKLKEQNTKSGEDGKALQDIIDKMDQIETDLVNKKLTNEMLKRQQDILTRLLEAERAEREREYDNKRKAESGEQKERQYPPSLEEYLKKRESEIEMFRQVSPNLKPYYKFLVDEYYKALKNSSNTQ